MRSNQFAAFVANDRAPEVIADIYNVDRLRKERGLYVETKRVIVNGKRRVVAKEVK